MEQLQADNKNVQMDGSGAMFDTIAPKYDRLNRLLSLGMDHSWRRQMGRALDVREGQQVLDVATGTGDLIVEIHAQQPLAVFTGIDTSANMLRLAAKKCEAQEITVHFELCDVHQLPFATESFDRACVAFGLRNFQDRPRALGELHRVLRPNGRLTILELSLPQSGPTAGMARSYIRHVVPRIGQLVSGKQAYSYLAQSIAAFPPANEVIALLQTAGFASITSKPLSFGACTLYVADKSKAL